MAATEKNANTFSMTSLTAVNSGYSLMLINNSTNEGQLIRMTDLANMIINEDQIPDDITDRIDSLENRIAGITGGVPTVVSSTSEMTDTDKIYILSTDGKWYYHNGTAWVAGGTYGAVATDTTLTQPGVPADAKAVGDAIKSIEPFSEDAKSALLNCFAHVAWIDAHGQDYYNALSDALNSSRIISSISAVFTQGSAVIYTDNSLNDLKPYLTVTARYSDGTTQTVTNYTLSGTLTKGTSTITASYGGKAATFNVTVSERSATLQSITAVFNQGSAVIYTDSSLNDLKPYLTVTARYSDSTMQTVTGYTLSGALTKGTSTITASYGGKTATFNVVVSERSSGTAVYKLSDGTLAPLTKGTVTTVDNRPCIRQDGAGQVINVLSGNVPFLIKATTSSTATESIYYPIPIPSYATRVTVSVLPNTLQINANIRKYENGAFTIITTGDKLASVQYDFTASEDLYVVGRVQSSDGTDVDASSVTDVIIECE